MEKRRQELLNEEDGYWRQRMDQQQLVEKLKAEVAEQEELRGHSEVSAFLTTWHAVNVCHFVKAGQCKIACHALSRYCKGSSLQPIHFAFSAICFGQTCFVVKKSKQPLLLLILVQQKQFEALIAYSLIGTEL